MISVVYFIGFLVPGDEWAWLSLLEQWQITVPAIFSNQWLNDEASFTLVRTPIINLVAVLVIIGGLLVGFSQEKEEDEYIASLRLRAVLWSLLVSYVVFLMLYLTLYGLIFLEVILLQAFLPLLLYIFRFRYLLSKNYEK
ncbi:hypothetical protein [Riemerella columbina]|uniref:hypothetical protein n=1 Tax=Riemerella columbina TaxID=103810 RepID=UPI002670226A|nr:hypothetical protein [Riemerella columbina]WKS94964.1 hypothetical protein NYR17_08545 [Riemerella columbina]